MSAPLGFGGISVRIRGLPPHLELTSLRPFFHPGATPDVCLELHDAPLPGASFTFERVDFALSLDLHNGVGRARLGAPAAVKALLGLTVQTILLHRRAGLVLHASGGLHGGRAWVACGRSEAGKSTAARLAPFELILSDEMIVARPSGPEGGWEAWSTPFWSEGRHEPLVHRRAPLHRFVRLHQAPRIAARPLPPDALAAHLLESVTLHQQDAWARAAAFELACDAALAVPGVDLWFTKEDPWLPVACQI